MEITKNDLIKIIQEIDQKIEKLTFKIDSQDKKILDLLSENKILKDRNQATLDQIKGYIQELEQIRNHYVDSNNKVRDEAV